MNIEEFREYCLSKKGVTEDLPFDENTLVFKLMGKMFALTDIDQFESINLKCDPDQAIELREKYASVQPGYHMNKKHWNTILVRGELSDAQLQHWIDHSYNLVMSKLTKKQKQDLNALEG
ncbi:MAG: MmcQ/YjbR family DNA-binding protein [Microscillaceae bacterium]|nr:MmcQ/YjbR family DNA-binding protein [Microscillaceae bacterium]